MNLIQSLLFALSLTTRRGKSIPCRLLIAWLAVTSVNLLALFLQEKTMLSGELCQRVEGRCP